MVTSMSLSQKLSYNEQICSRKVSKFLLPFCFSFWVFIPTELSEVQNPKLNTSEAVNYHKESERKCAEEALWFEAQGESKAGMQAVLDVIKNRTKAKDFPDTICKVIEQPKQFSYRQGVKQGVRLEIKPKNNLDKQAHAKVLSVLDEGFKEGYRPLVKPSVLWYTKTKVKTKWMKKMKVQVVIDSHKFMSMKGET